ncbi:MAG: membrane dipeptidase, partial [Sphingomonas sp.]
MNRPLIDRISLAGLALALVAPLPAGASGANDEAARVARILKATPLIDGHNDWAETARDEAGDRRWTLDLTNLPAPYNTDITRLHAGMVGG